MAEHYNGNKKKTMIKPTYKNAAYDIKLIKATYDKFNNKEALIAKKEMAEIIKGNDTPISNILSNNISM